MTRVKAAILAGGQGARFWPVSRQRRPKQFLKLGTTDESLIQATARRIEKLVGPENIMVVTGEGLRELVLQHVPHTQVLSEPFGRNTAASIGLAAAYAAHESPESILICLPSDHAVADEGRLIRTLESAVGIARTGDHLVTIGIPPAGPNTAYGYIQRGEKLRGSAFRVKRFYEKPSLERAVEYCRTGDFFWNSGMFVWRADTILTAVQKHMPALAQGLERISSAIGTSKEREVLKDVFENLESISIDFGLLEHADNCALVEAEPFGWNDVGSWDAWAEHFETDAQGNLLHSDAVVIDSTGCIVHSDTEGGRGRLTALLGVKDLVVIDSGDAVLICPRDRVQDVRKVVDALKAKGKLDLV